MAMPEKVDKPIGELISELTHELRTLLKQEMDLFRTEMQEKLIHFFKDAAAIGVGCALLYFGTLVLIAAIVLGVATFMPAWIAALLVATIFIVIGFVLVEKGRKDVTHMSMKPEKTKETFKETTKWAKTLR
jgi:Flp pilus assembly protein TadB